MSEFTSDEKKTVARFLMAFEKSSAVLPPSDKLLIAKMRQYLHTAPTVTPATDTPVPKHSTNDWILGPSRPIVWDNVVPFGFSKSKRFES